MVRPISKFGVFGLQLFIAHQLPERIASAIDREVNVLGLQPDSLNPSRFAILLCWHRDWPGVCIDGRPLRHRRLRGGGLGSTRRMSGRELRGARPDGGGKRQRGNHRKIQHFGSAFDRG